MIEVVTVFAPRPDHPQWRDYLPLLRLQRATAEHCGHRHLVVTDDAEYLREFDTIAVDLPQSLMHAQLAGQIAYLERWSGEHPAVLVDADCLIARDLSPAFDGSFDIGLTWRDNPQCAVNNGAMYLAAGARPQALGFFGHALTLCKEHWGGDQEAISQAAAPVPTEDGLIKPRQGARIAFLSMKVYNHAPRAAGIRNKVNPFVVHFKGIERKDWALEYAERFILGKG